MCSERSKACWAYFLSVNSDIMVPDCQLLVSNVWEERICRTEREERDEDFARLIAISPTIVTLTNHRPRQIPKLIDFE